MKMAFAKNFQVFVYITENVCVMICKICGSVFASFAKTQVFCEFRVTNYEMRNKA